ncbi:transcriptional regulator [Salmonella enterica]|nr:transcriptional regulator [Salmonella enterica]EKK6346502.1 transcriptional regulator [Salmonella enterica]ELO7821415.1 transcriptional regulator [Salmonella enterica]ELR6878431.1 transcriptional regulator [Salmonella enterica]MJK42723.1 transcriptional regulator [Salmonella enterica subsp. diarizonae]
MRTETCRQKAGTRHVIIHGDSWPMVSATEHMVKAVLPGSRCETSSGPVSLLQQLARAPDASLILCLRPREHIFLFCALKNALLSHPALIISDEMMFSDRVVLDSWGDLPFILHHELAGAITRIQQYDRNHDKKESRTDRISRLDLIKGRLADFLSDPKPATGFFAVPAVFTTRKRLMNYMALLMYRATVRCGVSPAQQKLLQEVYRGQHSLSELKHVLDKDEKKIWQDKNRLLIKLGMRNRLRELLYGTRFCESVQRTPFMAPEDGRQPYP